MVILLVEVKQLLVLQIGDGFWISSRVESILAILKQVGIDMLEKGVFRVAHCSFHFVEDHALEFKRCAWVVPFLELQAMALLSEVMVV